VYVLPGVTPRCAQLLATSLSPWLGVGDGELFASIVESVNRVIGFIPAAFKLVSYPIWLYPVVPVSAAGGAGVCATALLLEEQLYSGGPHSAANTTGLIPTGTLCPVITFAALAVVMSQ
jgi:hypothetical protein